MKHSEGLLKHPGRSSESSPASVKYVVKEHWSRHIATEFLGSLVSSFLSISIVAAASFDSALAAYLDYPTTIPNAHMLLISMGVAISFGLGMIVAPESELNPVFTLAIALAGAKPWRYVPLHFIGQFFGGLCASALAWQVTGHLIPFQTMNGQIKGVIKPKDYAAILGAPFPPEKADDKLYQYLTNGQCFLNTVVFIALMINVLVPALAIKNKHPAIKPVLVSFIIVAFVAAESPFGVVLNPFMWLCGALMASWVGDWDGAANATMWSYHDNYVWVALLGPFVGAIVGMVLLVGYSKLVYLPQAAKGLPHRSIGSTSGYEGLSPAYDP